MADVEAVMAELRSLAAEIDRLDQTAADLYGLNRTDQRALDIVARQGGMTPTELADALRMTTGGITTVVDRLERAGYVRRRADAADRRRVALEPTEQTARRDDEVFGRLIGASEDVIGSYPAAERAVIHNFLVRIREAIALHADSLRRDGGH